MTPQEIFEKSFIGIYNQGHQCVDLDGKCAYSGADGSACAVGILFDKEYRDYLEWKAFDLGMDELPRYVNNLPSWVDQNMELLKELQRGHDELSGLILKSAFRERWVGKCQKIADEFDLEMP